MDFELAFPSLVIARLLHAFAPLPKSLQYDQQLSSPLTSYSRCASTGIGMRVAEADEVGLQYGKGCICSRMEWILTLAVYFDMSVRPHCAVCKILM